MGHQTLKRSPPFADVVRLPVSQAVTSARKRVKKTKLNKRIKLGQIPVFALQLATGAGSCFLIMASSKVIYSLRAQAKTLSKIFSGTCVKKMKQIPQ